MPGAAFFDLDRTLISRSSSLSLAGTFRKRGLIGRRQVAKAAIAQLVFMRFGAGQGRVGQTADSGMSILRGLRVEEMRESVRIIEQCLDQMPEGPFQIDMPTVAFPVDKDRVRCSMEALIQHFDLSAYGFKVPKGEVYSAIEAPKGELGFYIISDGSEKPFRIKVRSPSFVNLQGLFGVSNARYLADMIAVLGSLDPVMAEVDK